MITNINKTLEALTPTISLKGDGVFLNLKPDFPSLYNKDIAYLDSASSAQKPQAVINAMTHVMSEHYANIHRGLYDYSQKTTEAFEAVREKIRAFINAKSENEIVFTRNTTEAINLVAQSYGRTFLNEGDEVILSEMEHHANIVPWQILRDEKGIVLKIIPVTDMGELDYQAFETLLTAKTKFISIVHISNALGTVNDVEKIIQTARAHNPEIRILIDGTQAVVHGVIDVQALDCDFFTFTGHKLYGPSGIGVLWGREDLLNTMPPYQGGGDMIEIVTFDKTTYKDAPARFEAGTPSIVDVIGLGAAIDYITAIGMDSIIAHENELLTIAREDLSEIKIYGDVKHKAPVISFTIDGAHHSDVGMIFNQCGVAVRTGHHCCMPLMQRYGIDGTVRASFGLYNNKQDIEKFIEAVDKAKRMLM
jgi:cysteine desulfurase/selenocysteine lyase